MSLQFRDLKASEIDVRIGQVKPNGVVLLLYKDARCDMNILDETVGVLNWEREHYECKGNLFCRVGINLNYDKPDALPLWVYKADCGTESNTEKEKGESSDSFKRACVNFSIGRELYSAPFIWVSSDNCTIKDKKCYDKFVVEKIKIENKQITGLSIINKSMGCRVFVWTKEKDGEKA